MLYKISYFRFTLHRICKMARLTLLTTLVKWAIENPFIIFGRHVIGDLTVVELSYSITQLSSSAYIFGSLQ